MTVETRSRLIFASVSLIIQLTVVGGAVFYNAGLLDGKITLLSTQVNFMKEELRIVQDDIKNILNYRNNVR